MVDAAQQAMIVSFFRDREIDILEELLEKLENKGIDVSPYWGYITSSWWEKVLNFLTPYESTAGIIRNIRTSRFFALEYFLHECMEISYYEKRGIQIDKRSNNPGHIEALKREYLWWTP